MPNADLIYNADLAPSEEFIKNYCCCNYGIHWIPSIPPPDFSPSDLYPPDCCIPNCCPKESDFINPPPRPPHYQYPFYPYPPYFKPPVCNCNCGTDNEGGDNNENGNEKPNPPEQTEPEINSIEIKIRKLTKKLTAINCMIDALKNQKSDYIMKTSCCSYNFGNIDLEVNDWEDGSHAQSALKSCYKEREVIQEKIKELASQLGEESYSCSCSSCMSIEKTASSDD